MIRRLRQLGAILILAGLVVGVPWLFAATIGNPLHGWKDLSAGDLSGTVVIDVLAAVVWIAWAQFAVSVIVEAYAAIGNTRLPSHIPGVFSGQQHLARRLVTAALLIGTVAAVIPAMPHASATPPPVRPTIASAVITPTRSPSPSTAAAAQPVADHSNQNTAASAAPQTTVYVVPSGGRGPDALWDIAETHLGAGERWHEIWALNQGRTQPDGTIMTDPGLLRPGWTVLIPAQAAPAAPATDDVVTVVPGDTLTDIADEHGSTEPTVWQLNRGRVMSDGRRFTNPDLIKPGDTIVIPAIGAPVSTPNSPTTPATPPSSPPSSSPPPASPPSSDQPEPSTSSAPDRPTPTPSSNSTDDRPPTTAAAPTPTPTAGAAGPAQTADHPSRPVANYLAVLGGGAALLAASLYAALRRYRRRQLRHRPAGHAPALTSPALRAVDAAVLIAGAPALGIVETIDRALRALRQSEVDGLAGTAPGWPALLTLTVDRSAVQLHLADPAPFDPPPPWQPTGTRTWQASRTELNRLPVERDVPAPYPTLVSAVYDEDRETLLHLAEFGALAVTGDAEHARDWLRFIAGELAHNSWSDHLTVTVAGLEPGLVALNPARLAHTDDIPAAVRGLDMTGDVPDVLILGPGWHHDRDDRAAITGILPTLIDPARAGLGPVLIAYLPDSAEHDASDSAWDAALQLHLDGDGTLRCLDTGGVTAEGPGSGLVLLGPAPQLSATDAADLAALLAAARDTGDASFVPLAPPQPDQRAGEPFGTAEPASAEPDGSSGDDMPSLAELSPAVELRAVANGISTAPAPAPTEAAAESDASSLLPAADAHYVSLSATTAADLQFLAPSIQLTVAAGLDYDTALDADLTAWRDPDSPQAKLTLLGPVTLTAHGRLPDGRIAFYTEVVTYLALHRRGVTGDRFAADLWPDRELTGRDSSPKNALSIVRKWLGVDPMTGADYLPVAAGTDSPDGVPTYRISGLLVDWDLFCRLRSRAQTKGAGGIADLIAALDVVSGEPLGRRRLEGYGWLRDGTAIDEDGMSVAIVDVAHTVATAALADGDIDTAQHAVDIALSVGPADDRPLLDQAAVLDAQGRHAELAATVRRIRAHHEAEVEEDLPPRTYEILLRRGWLAG